MTEFVHELANQDEPAPETKRVRFEVKQWLATLPTPTTQREDRIARQSDPAFHWVLIPNVFAYYSSLDNLRRRFPEYQFDYATPKGGKVTLGKNAGKPGYRIRVRWNPHVDH